VTLVDEKGLDALSMRNVADGSASRPPPSTATSPANRS
jgi:hypothetical protein